MKNKYIKSISIASLSLVVAASALFFPKLSAADSEKYVVNNRISVYTNAYDAKSRTNSTGKWGAGTYYVYRKFNGSINITDVQGEPGGWINPADNTQKNSAPAKKNVVSSPSQEIVVDNTGKMKLTANTPIYISAYDAKNKVNQRGTFFPGDYYIYREYDGAFNLTRKKGVPGGWIYFDSKIKQQTKVESKLPEVKETIKDSKKNMEVHSEPKKVTTLKPEEKFQTEDKKLTDEEMILVFKKNKKEIKAVDISVWNGDTIYWDKLRANDIKGVIVRGGYSTEVDRNAKKNIREAIENGFHVGAYWAMYPISEEEAVKEARTFNNLMSEFKGKIELPLFADFEYFSDKYAESQGVNLSKKQRTDIVIKFLDTLKSYGWYVGNYANVDYMENYFESARLENYDLWIADWRIVPSEKWVEKSGIHQYSSDGAKYGTGSTSTDMNKIFYDYPSIIKNLGFNGFIRNINMNNIKNHKPSSSETSGSKSVTDLAYEVINNNWGVWPDRQKRLEKAGYDYHAIQKRVNEILGY